MELRSRSRSKTPFQTQSFLETEAFESANNVTITRSQRSTRTTNYSDAAKKSKSAKAIRSVFKTSDYSSDEDLEFSHLSENEKNQIIEDARAAANGSAEISALNLYRKAGRYWDKYPKTDYTYSRHSRDRVEIAPGVVQMPNMSRRTIHLDSSTNTDTSYTSKAHLVKQRLFSSSNNNEEEIDGSFKISRASLRSRTFLSYFVSVFTSVYSLCVWCLWSSYEAANSTMVYFGKQVHHLASRVMLLDTWLLRKSVPGRRTKGVVALCLLPLVFFAGVHVLLASGVSLAPFCHPHCGSYISNHYHSFINATSNMFQLK